MKMNLNKWMYFVLFGFLLACVSGCDTSKSVTYKVSYVLDDEVYEVLEVTENTKVSELKAPSFENRIFEYWMLDGEKFDFTTKINKDITLTAKYMENTKTYKVTYQLMDGSTQFIYVEENKQAIMMNPPVVEGYTFLYWTVDGKEFDFSAPITKDVTLVATYQKSVNYYFVTFYVNENTYKKVIVAENGLLNEIPNPTLTGYKFLYWTVDGEEFDFSTPITFDLELVAKFEKNSGGSDQDPIHIRYWHANGPALTAVLEEIKANFEAKYNGKYVVELTSYGDYTNLRDTIAASIAAGDMPTAAQTYPDHVALYLEGEALVSLDKYINDPVNGMSKAEQAQFIEGFWNEGTIYDQAGTRYAMPFNKSTELMYYNKDMFDKYGWSVPTTWDEVIAICEKFKQTTEYQEVVRFFGEKSVYGLGYDSESNLFITLTQQYGATFTSFDAIGKGVYNAFGGNADDTAKSKEALSWYYQQYQKGNVATSTVFGTNYCSDAFKNGQCIMSIGSSAGANFHNGQESSGTRFTTGVAAVPQKDVKNGQVVQQGTNVSLFKCASAEEELGGWLWLKHMVSYESALTWATKTAYFPIRKDVINSKEYQNHINGVTVVENLDGTTSEIHGTPSLSAQAKKAGLLQQNWFYTNIVFSGSSKARDVAEIMVQRLLYGADGPSIDTVYQEAYDLVLYY